MSWLHNYSLISLNILAFVSCSHVNKQTNISYINKTKTSISIHTDAKRKIASENADMGAYGWKQTFVDDFDNASTAIAKGASPSCFSMPAQCMIQWWTQRDCNPNHAAQLSNLNKCNWKIYNHYNWMDYNAPDGTGFNAFDSSQVKVYDGNLHLLASRSSYPEGTFDCKNKFFDPVAGTENYSTRCPVISGGILSQPFEYNGQTMGFAQEFGRFEVRAKIPGGPGAWPAHWMLADKLSNEPPGNCGWPHNGEIDIMEANAHEPGQYYATYHDGICAQKIHLQKSNKFKLTKKKFPGKNLKTELYDNYHVYAAEWDANSIRFYIDDFYVGNVRRGEGVEGRDMNQVPEQIVGYDFPAEIPIGKFFFILNSTILNHSSWPADKRPNPANFQTQDHVIDYVKSYRACTKDDPKEQCQHFKVKGTVWDYNSHHKWENAEFEMNMYPNPVLKGNNITARITALQSCEDVKVSVIDVAGRRIQIDSPELQGRRDYLINGKMERNEVQVFTLQTGTTQMAAGMYLLHADFRKCEPDGLGQGNHVFKFIIQ